VVEEWSFAARQESSTSQMKVRAESNASVGGYDERKVDESAAWWGPLQGVVSTDPISAGVEHVGRTDQGRRDAPRPKLSAGKKPADANGDPRQPECGNEGDDPERDLQKQRREERRLVHAVPRERLDVQDPFDGLLQGEAEGWQQNEPPDRRITGRPPAGRRDDAREDPDRHRRAQHGEEERQVRLEAVGTLGNLAASLTRTSEREVSERVGGDRPEADQGDGQQPRKPSLVHPAMVAHTTRVREVRAA